MKLSHAQLDNRSQQLNPENDAYWKARGYDARPVNWEAILSAEGLKASNGSVVKR